MTRRPRQRLEYAALAICLACAGSAPAPVDHASPTTPPAPPDAKTCKMLLSPHATLRGSNALFWRRHGRDPRLQQFSTPHTETWIQGDSHVYNFGAFDDDDGDVIYGLNDFDEAVIADVQYDLWRLGASLVLLGRERHLSSAQISGVVDHMVGAYLDRMSSHRGNKSEESLKYTASDLTGPVRGFLESVTRSGGRKSALERYTRVIGPARHLDTTRDDLAQLSASELSLLRAAMSDYLKTLSGKLPADDEYFTIKSAARRLGAGIGSLGVARYYLLIEGPSADSIDDRILDVKEQRQPAAAREHAGIRDRMARLFHDEAERHAAAVKALHIDTDDHLGWLRLDGRSFSVRERSVYKQTFPVEELTSVEELEQAAADWGQVLATSHARGDKDFRREMVDHSVDRAIAAIAESDRERFIALVAELAHDVADEAERDHRELLKSAGASCATAEPPASMAR